LPHHKRRFWSRPLVALLFFLQPIARDWARFQWRLSLFVGRQRNQREPVPHPVGQEPPETQAYWTDQSLDRYAFLDGILSELAQAGWRFKTDTGWTSRDLELTADLWTRLALTTVTEELGQGKKNLRCRVRRFWSLPARMLFWDLAAGIALVVVMFSAAIPWLWMSLVLLPLVGWVLDEASRDRHWAIAAVLDTVSREHKMVRLNDD
jgi:hypothetical protein